MTKSLVLLPGDGIGPEVCAEVRRIAEWFNQNAGLGVSITEHVFGGASYDRFGKPLADSALQAALGADAVVMGAVGGPQWSDVPREVRPEAGLLKLRERLGAFANLRPVTCFDALADASSLKR